MDPNSYLKHNFFIPDAKSVICQKNRWWVVYTPLCSLEVKPEMWIVSSDREYRKEFSD